MRSPAVGSVVEVAGKVVASMVVVGILAEAGIAAAVGSLVVVAGRTLEVVPAVVEAVVVLGLWWR